jgi:hypothetical protein
MKRILILASAVAGLFLASCQQDFNPVTDGNTSVTFSVSAGDVMTKAIADASNIDVLYWEIYNTADIATASGPLGEGEGVKTGDKTFTVKLKLLADQKYTIIFWAEKKGEGHYDTEDLRSIGVDYSDENANDESRAAFFAVYPFETENGKAIEETVTLYRPFSQLNLGTTTYETSFNKVEDQNVKVITSQMTITNIATSFNTLTGHGEGEQKVTFTAAATPNGVEDQTKKLLEVNKQKYYWIGMNYLIVCGDKDSDNVTVDIELSTNFGDISHSIDNVTIKENYRTNILGNILTTGATYNVVVDEDFQTPDYNVSVSGEYTPVAEGLSVDELGTYHVTTASGLQYFTNKSVADGTVIDLDADIDFEGAEFKAIAADYNSTFTFNGNGHTISNIKIVECSHNTVGAASLFFCYTGGVIRVRDLIVDNAVSEGATYVGAILGYTQGDALLSDITVKNSSISGVKKVGGLVGFVENSTSSFVAENCHVVKTSVVATEKQAGTIIGYNAKPATLRNCTAEESTADSPAYCDGGIRSTDPLQAELIVE